MNVTTKIFFGAMALGLVACSNEIPGVEDQPEELLTGKTAYMRVNITSVGDLTRATEDQGFAYGEAGEHTVNDAQFFFFDENGLFVTKATVWTGGKENTPDGQAVEYIGNNVIVLKNLTSTPVRYMLTVLNLPDFQPSNTIEATATQLQNYSNTILGVNYHVMTTSSYFGANAHHSNKYPYATYIQNGDYTVQPADANFSADDLETNVVDVYVERLAAKVQVELADGFTSGNDPVEGKDGTVLYPIRASVSGYNNGTLDNVDDTGAEMLYVKFTGWGLNAVLPKSTLFKQIDADWERNAPFEGWNDADNFRSYWTKTPYYGEDPGDLLAYLCFKDANTQIGDSKLKSGINYCNGNTNTLERIYSGQSLIPSKVTNVLIAGVICNRDGDGLDLIRATSGEMYTKQSYINYIFSLVNPQIFTKDDDGQGMTQITPNDLNLDWEMSGGKLRIAVKGLKTEEKDLYNPNGEKINNADSYISGAFNNTQANLSPEAYNGGAMYYSIPIEHMAAVGADDSVKPYNTLGYYGVVRNFWYKITLNSLTRFGHGVFDPENDRIIPDAPDDENYLLGAKINILSWKVLNQSVNM